MITSSSSSTRAAALLLAAAALADGRVLLHNHAEKIHLEAGEQHLAVANHQKKNLGRTMAEMQPDPDYAATQGKLGQTPASKGMCCSFYWMWSLVAFAVLTIIALIVANWINYKKREEQGREANDELQARGKKVHVEANDPFGSKGKKAQEEMSKKQ